MYFLQYTTQILGIPRWVRRRRRRERSASRVRATRGARRRALRGVAHRIGDTADDAPHEARFAGFGGHGRVRSQFEARFDGYFLFHRSDPEAWRASARCDSKLAPAKRRRSFASAHTGLVSSWHV